MQVHGKCEGVGVTEKKQCRLLGLTRLYNSSTGPRGNRAAGAPLRARLSVFLPSLVLLVSVLLCHASHGDISAPEQLSALSSHWERDAMTLHFGDQLIHIDGLAKDQVIGLWSNTFYGAVLPAVLLHSSFIGVHALAYMTNPVVLWPALIACGGAGQLLWYNSQLALFIRAYFSRLNASVTGLWPWEQLLQFTPLRRLNIPLPTLDRMVIRGIFDSAYTGFHQQAASSKQLLFIPIDVRGAIARHFIINARFSDVFYRSSPEAVGPWWPYYEIKRVSHFRPQGELYGYFKLLAVLAAMEQDSVIIVPSRGGAHNRLWVRFTDARTHQRVEIQLQGPFGLSESTPWLLSAVYEKKDRTQIENVCCALDPEVVNRIADALAEYSEGRFARLLEYRQSKKGVDRSFLYDFEQTEEGRTTVESIPRATLLHFSRPGAAAGEENASIRWGDGFCSPSLQLTVPSQQTGEAEQGVTQWRVPKTLSTLALYAGNRLLCHLAYNLTCELIVRTAQMSGVTKAMDQQRHTSFVALTRAARSFCPNRSERWVASMLSNFLNLIFGSTYACYRPQEHDQNNRGELVDVRQRDFGQPENLVDAGEILSEEAPGCCNICYEEPSDERPMDLRRTHCRQLICMACALRIVPDQAHTESIWIVQPFGWKCPFCRTDIETVMRRLR